MDGSEWKAALRLQIEALARRNELHRRCNRDSVWKRTADMDVKIVRLRELVATDANYAAQFYLECVCHADETERILNRAATPLIIDNSSYKPAVEITLPERSSSNRGPRWWEQLSIHRKHQEHVDDRQKVRNLWKTQADCFLSCLGFVIGIGNMLKFPGKICEYGGIFIAPYFVCLIFIGFPMLHLHLCIGQYAGETPDAAFYRLMPITCGSVGWAFVLAAIPVIIYHNFVVIWSLQYLWYSMLSMVISDRMPWENRVATFCLLHQRHCDIHVESIPAPMAHQDFHFFGVDSHVFSFDILSLTSYTQLAPSLPQRHIVLALTSAWLLIFICICKGTTWMTWAFRLTATIPYLMLFILLIRGLSLPGASIGLSFLFSSVIFEYKSSFLFMVSFILINFGVGTGAIMSIAAYSKYRNYVYRDAALLAIINAFTSVLASMVLFSFLGLLSISSGKDISSIINHDPFYMIFTVIPSTTSLMRWGPLWMSILFATVVLTAMDAEFIWIEMLASSVMNKALKLRPVFLKSCFQCQHSFQDGFFVFHSMNSLISSVPTFILSFLVLTAFTYLYGVDRFLKDVSSMLRIPMGNATKWVHLRVQEKLLELFGPCGSFIRISWVLICPCFLTVSAMFSDIKLYIDPTSRGPTIRSACQPCVDNYGWRNGRLKEWQVSQPCRFEHKTSFLSFLMNLSRLSFFFFSEYVALNKTVLGVRQQRSTIIRRFRSEDSVQAFSTGSISITPIGIARQRSLSSVAIYDNIILKTRQMVTARIKR
uniref:Transporter n=1 Tax=Angiostrongylus cantonensis TaxID=6313 RepID=A0A0K0DIU8_ANGCA